ncbi:acyltransferase family protein [Paraburkholderia bannensis]|uniref:acyltransferase family protein n=1 Tax=Paraburkholderia bannensis TaxID=765414 RepID=UPI002AC36C06|nr:acyltransferase [Paraburkholderia bannensis]
MSNKDRLHELDSLRALAAIGVIGWHYTNHFHASPFPHLMAPFYRHGLLLVDFFFVLSGFVLARTYWTENRAPNFAVNMRDRIARLYPLHIVTLCIVGVMQWMLVSVFHSEPFMYEFNNARNLVLNLLLMNRTGLEHGYSYNAPSWSISVEFIVNVAFLAAITAHRRTAAAIISIGALASAFVVARNGLISNATVFGIDNDVFRATFGFCLGVALHSFCSRPARLRAPRFLYDALALVALFAFLSYCASARTTGYLDLAVSLICFPALIIGAMRGRIVRGFLRMPPLVFLGTISYSIYLVHFPVQLGAHVFEIASGNALPYESRFLFVSLLLITIAISWATYHLVELPGKTGMKRLLGGSRSNPQTTSN